MISSAQKPTLQVGTTGTFYGRRVRITGISQRKNRSQMSAVLYNNLDTDAPGWAALDVFEANFNTDQKA